MCTVQRKTLSRKFSSKWITHFNTIKNLKKAQRPSIGLHVSVPGHLHGCWLSVFVGILTVGECVSLTLLSALETLFLLLNCLVQLPYKSRVILFALLYCFVLSSCCLLEACSFLKRRQKRNYWGWEERRRRGRGNCAWDVFYERKKIHFQ